MAVKGFKTFISNDRDTQQLQDNVQQAIGPLISGLGGRAQFFPAVSIGTTATPLVHNLGYPVTFWFVANLDSNSVVYQSSSQPSPTTTLTLQASVACTAGIWLG